jgi:glycosyltransferase involved in cell wall biosynthesis
MNTINVTIISYYYLPEYSGAALQIKEIIRNSDCDKIKFNVIAAKLSKKVKDHEITDDNYEIKRIETGKKKSLIYFWLRLAVEIYKQRKSTDIIFINGLKPAHSIAIMMAKLLGKPSVGRLSIAESDIVFKNQGRIIGPLSKGFLKKANKYIAISTRLKEEIKNSGLDINKTEIIYNGVNQEIYHPLDPEKKIKQKNRMGYQGFKILLFVGVIDNRKGVDILINAYKKINQTVKNTKLIIIGPPNRDDTGKKYLNGIYKLAKDMNIQNNIDFIGFKNSIEISRYYQVADIFILPSRKEGMPNVIIEAMSCGLPIIGTKISGIEDLVRDGINGYLVEAGDSNTLSKATIELMENPENIIEMGRQSLKIVKKYHDIRKISEKYSTVFNDLIHKKEIKK